MWGQLCKQECDSSATVGFFLIIIIRFLVLIAEKEV